ncbi:MAG: hypothetical protein ACR2QF_13645 [Geminicoccaceae bacterium]
MLKLIRAAILALGPIFVLVSPAIAGEYQCRQKDSAIRIAIEVKKKGHTLPCEVIAEDDRGERAILYKAQYDRDYCPERLEQTRAKLEDEDWTCQKTSDNNVVEGEGHLRPLDELAASESGSEEPKEPEAAIVASSQVCRLDDDVRRLRIEVENPNEGKPCSLIYWAEDDQSENGQVLWRAEHDAEFCPKRLGFIVKKWTDEGWQCGADGETDTLQTATLPADEEPLTPAQDVPAEEIPTEPLSTETIPIEPAETQTIPAPEELAVQPTAPEDIDPNLQAVIEADAKRIGEWMEVEPGVEIAAFGDLNADGRNDAVIFLAYQSEQAAYRQYLMSYLLADETYELAGIKLLTGVSPPPDHAKVKAIDEGVIWLSLPEDNGDQTGSIGYRLHDQQLVEVDTSQQARSASN